MITEEQRIKQRLYSKRYREKYPEKVKEYIRKYLKTYSKLHRTKLLENYKRHMDKTDFGGNRELVIKRDMGKCVTCGITREQHKTKYGKDITVDHIDRNGRGKTNKNNSLSNLQTLCSSCHATKDNLLWWSDYKNALLKARQEGGSDGV